MEDPIMALAIVPPPAPVAPLDLFDLTAAYDATYAEVHSLALELCETEGLDLTTAMHTAADDLGYCLAYARRWNDAAWDAGNEAAAPF